jgi:hypothetical protein
MVVSCVTPTGARQELAARPSYGDWIVSPDGDGTITLRVEIRDPMLQWQELTAQEVNLPEDAGVIDVPLDIDEGILEHAERIAEAVRARNKR